MKSARKKEEMISDAFHSLGHIWADLRRSSIVNKVELVAGHMSHRPLRASMYDELYNLP